AASRQSPVESIPRGQKFVRNFTSAARDNRPATEMSVLVEFISPLGETNLAGAFWNGGTEWQVRFCPEICGRWKLSTICSDTNNAGLHAQSGEFLCTAPARRNLFDQHGGLQISRDGRRFEYADHTPFPVLLAAGGAGDPGLKRAALSSRAQLLAAGKFSAVLITLPRAARLADWDAQLDALNDAGLVPVIAPLWEIGLRDEELLDEAAAISLWRNAIARWNANHALWLFACEGQGLGAKVNRWQKIGRAVFGNSTHAPVIFYPGTTAWMMDEFRDENWVGAFGFKTADANQAEALRWMLLGPLASEWKKSPARPLLSLSPQTDSRLAWWSLFLAPPCGTSFASDSAILAKPTADLFGTIDFAQLAPAPRLLARQPGYDSPTNFVSVLASASRDLVAAYLPQGGRLELVSSGLPAATRSEWFNPHSGEKTPARAEVHEARMNFQSPTRGEWLLIVRSAGK
ncbi:MAG: DUF5060 domain-containing protein, partial [Verrucomicrobia bacterium]